MRGHAFRSGGLSYPAIVCRLFRAGGRAFFFGDAVGYFLFQSQKRGISNCPGSQEFCQRDRNSSRSDCVGCVRQTGR